MDLKYNSDSQTVRWSTIVLCASLLLIYVVLYYVKWDIFKWWDVTIEDNWWLTVSEVDNIDYSMKNNSWIESENNVLDSWVDSKSEISTPTISEYNIWETSHSTSTLSEMIVLPWTHSYYWSLDFVDLLWISYKYALKDDKWIYYLNMDGYTYDFSDIARKLWWNLYIMNTESEILANKLFGDKITYINIPEYANRRVLMLVYVNSQTWLLALDLNVYHQSKSYLQSLFIY